MLIIVTKILTQHKFSEFHAAKRNRSIFVLNFSIKMKNWSSLKKSPPKISKFSTSWLVISNYLYDRILIFWIFFISKPRSTFYYFIIVTTNTIDLIWFHSRSLKILIQGWFRPKQLLFLISRSERSGSDIKRLWIDVIFNRFWVDLDMSHHEISNTS